MWRLFKSLDALKPPDGSVTESVVLGEEAWVFYPSTDAAEEGKCGDGVREEQGCRAVLSGTGSFILWSSSGESVTDWAYSIHLAIDHVSQGGAAPEAPPLPPRN